MSVGMARAPDSASIVTGLLVPSIFSLYNTLGLPLPDYLVTLVGAEVASLDTAASPVINALLTSVTSRFLIIACYLASHATILT